MHEEWVTVAPCGEGACVEVAFDGDQVRVRSSLKPRIVVKLTRAEWDAFTRSIRQGLLSDR